MSVFISSESKPYRYRRHASKPGRDKPPKEAAAHYDYIVVGAGSAGCVVASRLSEDQDHPATVLLLEAGGPDDDPRIHNPEDFEELQGSEFDWAYQTEAEPALLGRNVPWPRGKTLGGSSSINALVYVRGNRRDFDHWAELGNDGWSYDEVLPYFKKAEKNERAGISLEVHGDAGPLVISNLNPPNAASVAFVKAAAQAGYDQTADFNDLEQTGGAGLYQVTIKDGKRSSAATAYLSQEVRNRHNLTIATRAQSTRLVIEKHRAVGVEYEDQTDSAHTVKKTARANREVIVCCGAVDSPKLLMLSGIGPANYLKSLGINVEVNLPGVGQNLQDHPIAPLIYLYKDGKKSKPPAAGGVEAGLFLNTRDGSEWPDLQFHFTHKLLGRVPNADAGFMIVSTLVKPLSRGSIHLSSANPADKPLIRANYLADEADLRTLVEGIKIARKIGQQKALNSLRGPEAYPGPDTQTDEQIEDFIRHVAIGLYHPVGTCAMGKEPERGAVVDLHLSVHGIKGLRVVDASVMPVITTGNTNAATIMIAEKAADLIKNPPTFNIERAARSIPREEALVRYGFGRDGKLRSDGRGVSFIVDMYKLDGEPDGTVVILSETTVQDPKELLKQPDNPNVTAYDEKPVEHVQAKSFGKALWTFPDGSTLTALGLGNSNIEILKSGDVLTSEVLAMLITSGTGRYKGAHGSWTTNRVLANPPGGALIDSQGEFTQKQVHVLRVVRGVDLKMPKPSKAAPKKEKKSASKARKAAR